MVPEGSVQIPCEVSVGFGADTLCTEVSVAGTGRGSGGLRC